MRSAPPETDAGRGPAGWLVTMARLTCRIFFRSLEVDGLERIPADRPLLVVANHVSSLVDPALLLATLARPPRFLGKSTLWQMALLRPLLAAAGVIPVYRQQDGGDRSGNLETFARCHQILAAGGVIALFPEGISHNRPALAPLRTGAARIVLEAEATRGPLGARIVPVGLGFERKDRFRSRALVRIGPPLDPAPELAAWMAAEDGPGAASEPAVGERRAAAVRGLTARIDAALRGVTVNYPSWVIGRLLERAADLVRYRELELPALAPLAAEHDTARALADGYAALAAAYPAETAAVARAVERYDRLLAWFALRDEQVVARYPWPRVLAWVGRSLLWLAVLLPLAVVGSLLNLPAWLAVDAVARRKAGEPDVAATWKLLPALLAYPLGWALCGVVVGLLAEPLLGAATAFLGAASALPALAFHERRARLWREARAFLLLRTRGRLAAELRARREETATAVERLIARWRELPG